MLVSSIESIINEKPNELLVHSNIVKFNNTDLDEIINTYTIKEYLEVLTTIANSLDIGPYKYSLADRLK
jgi:aminoglycoside N3'-acetyltransferase